MKVSNMKVISTINARYEGLTEGKAYRVYAIKESKGCKYPQFMVYNDNGEWFYCLSCWFKPAEE